MYLNLILTISLVFLSGVSCVWADSKHDSAVMDALAQAQQQLRDHPGNQKARLEMSAAQIELGQFDAAIAELERLGNDGFDEQQRLPLLATAYTRQSRYRELLSQIKVNEGFRPDIQATLYGRRSYAYSRLGKPELAAIPFARAKAAGVENWVVGKSEVGRLMDAGNFSAAHDRMSVLLERWPDKKELILLNADIYSAMQQFSKSVAIYKNLQQTFPHDEWIYWQTSSALVRDFISEEQYRHAELLIGQMLEKEAERPYTNYLGAIVAQLMGDSALALDRVSRVLTEVPGHRLAQQLIGKIYFNRGLYKQAEFYLSKVVAREPGNLRLRLLLAETYFGLREFDIGLSVLKSAPEDQQETTQLLYLLAVGSISKASYQEGFQYLNQILALYPDQFNSVRVVVSAELEFGDSGRAIALLDQWLERHPADRDARWLLSKAWYRHGHPQQALDLALSLDTQQEQNPELLVYIGRLYGMLGDFNHAEKYYLRVQEIVPNDGDLLLARARLLEEKGQNHAAIKAYKKLIDRKSIAIPAMTGLVRIAISQNDMQALLYWLGRMRADSPRNLDSRVMLANHYLEQHKYTEVHALSRELLSAGSHKKASRLIDALALIGEGRYHEASITLSKALALSTALEGGRIRPVMNILLAQSQLLLGDETKALQTVNRLLSSDHHNIPALALNVEIGRRSGDMQRVQEARKKLADLGVVLPEVMDLKDPLAFISLADAKQDSEKNTPLEQLVFGGLRIVLLDQQLFKPQLNQAGMTLLSLNEAVDDTGSLVKVINSEFIANLYKEKKEKSHYFAYNEFQVDFWNNYFSIGLVETTQAQNALKKEKKKPVRILRKPSSIALAGLAIILLVLIFRQSDKHRKMSMA